MVILKLMRKEEYPAYRQYFIEDYSQEIAKTMVIPRSLLLS